MSRLLIRFLSTSRSCQCNTREDASKRASVTDGYRRQLQTQRPLLRHSHECGGKRTLLSYDRGNLCHVAHAPESAHAPSPTTSPTYPIPRSMHTLTHKYTHTHTLSLSRGAEADTVSIESASLKASHSERVIPPTRRTGTMSIFSLPPCILAPLPPCLPPPPLSLVRAHLFFGGRRVRAFAFGKRCLPSMHPCRHSALRPNPAHASSSCMYVYVCVYAYAYAYVYVYEHVHDTRLGESR